VKGKYTGRIILGLMAALIFFHKVDASEGIARLRKK